jgi:hypothetical protein
MECCICGNEIGIDCKQLQAENARLREALVWYEKWVGECNRDGREGDIARNRLAKDVGHTASAALGKE